MNEDRKRLMTDVITLGTIDTIFNECADVPLTPFAKMLYINCLTHHFKKHEAVVINMRAFSIHKDELGYYKYQKSFLELEKAGLVSTIEEEIHFHNHWGKLIDHDEMKKVSPEEYVAGVRTRGIEFYEEDFKVNQQIVDVICMKYKARPERVNELRAIFIQEQKTYDHKYKDLADCLKHFNYWIRSQIERSSSSSAQSSGKILGMQ